MSTTVRVLRRILSVLLVLVLVLVLVLGGLLVWNVRRGFPTTDGTIALAGLNAPVRVIRDTSGIPYIYASGTHDLFFAQGYVHAQDRFWQMDYWRHITAGRLAELFGPDLVETDAFLRTLGWHRVAAEEWAALDEEARRIFQAYADGVNAYLAERTGSALSLEHGILRLQNRSYEPEPWTPVDSLAFAKLMAWDLRSNIDTEIERAILAAVVGPERLEDLYPPYPTDRHPLIVPGPATASATALDTVDEVEPLLLALKNLVDEVEAYTGPFGDGIGSNSWAVSGARTTTGMPLLANDPHLSIQMPSIWYVNALHCEPVGADCPYQVAGVSFASAPGVIIGHNDRIAWGFTNLAADVMDLYIEKVDPDDPGRYELDGEWVDMAERTEVIEVAGGEPVELVVRETIHGPVISGVFGALEDLDRKTALEIPDTWAVSLRWTALEPTSTVRAILGFNRAQDWDDFREAARGFDVPSQNLLYADVDGHIGYQSPGRIPIRAAGDGRLPAPGWTGTHEWIGFIPFEDLPHRFDPPEGFIVTANNQVVGDDYPYFLGREWAYGYRARRIVDLVEGATQLLDVAAIERMQMDAFNLSAEELLPVVLAVDVEDPQARRALDELEDWTRGEDAFHMRATSRGAAVWAATWRAIVDRTFSDEIPEDLAPDGGSRWMEVVRRLFEQPESVWWDDVTTPQRETRDDIIAAALVDAMADLRVRLGDDVEGWRWGDLHTATFRNATFGSSGIGPLEALFNRGPYAVSGGSAQVNNTAWVTSVDDYTVQWLPSMRMIVDLADLDRSRIVHTTGQSGHPYHRHYDDLIDDWVRGRTRPLPWQSGPVDAESTLVLEPAG